MRLIDADALMEELSKWLKEVDPTDPPENFPLLPLEEDIIVSTLMTIEEQPTIEAVPVVHGRWTHREDKNGYICNCEQKFFSWNEHPYCQHCGRKMDGGEE